MQTEKIRILNAFEEELDVLIEGNIESDSVLVFMHGFGADKNEGSNLFVDIADAFKDNTLCIRFDQSGWGVSDGTTEEFHLQKAAEDLEVVIKYVRQRYPEKEISLIAHSLGAFEVALLSPDNIKSIVMTGIPNADGAYVAQQIQDRIVSKNGELNIGGISTYPRTSGDEQKIGKDLWRTLVSIDIVVRMNELGQKTKLTIFKPMQDNIVGQEHFEAYKTIDNVDLKEVEGDHNFTNPEDRKILISKIRKILQV